jgi:hypothetical protein
MKRWKNFGFERAVLRGGILVWLGLFGVVPVASASDTPKSVAQVLSDHWDLTYFFRLNGPQLGGPLYQGYNVFTGDKWPLQAFQSIRAAARPNLDWAVGVETGWATNLNSRVMGGFGAPIEAGTTLFHPMIFAKRYSLIDNSWSFWNLELGLILPTSSLANQQTQLGAFPLNLTLNFKLRAPWQLDLGLQLQPTFYLQAYPSESWMLKRQTFYTALMHNLYYALSDEWELANGTHFDAQHLADSTVSVFKLEPSTDARMEWKLNRFFLSRSMRFGVALTHRLPLPSLDTTTANFEFNWDLF